MAYVNNDYLAKMGWRILSNKTNLWPNLMPQKFLHNTYLISLNIDLNLMNAIFGKSFFRRVTFCEKVFTEKLVWDNKLFSGLTIGVQNKA